MIKQKEKSEGKSESGKKELYLENNELIRESEWTSRIENLKREVDDEIKKHGYLNEKDSIKILKEKIEQAIVKRVSQKNAVLYSGGIDSTLIAYFLKKQGCDFLCCTVGLKESPDVKKAREYSKIMGFKTKIRIITQEELLDTIKEVIRIINSYDKMKVGVGSVVFLGIKIAKSYGIRNVFSGLGAEELFAGYQRHLKALNEKRDVNEECWNGLKTMYERDLIRDYKIASYLGIKLRTPFLDEDLIKTAMMINQELKISEVEKKIILRKLGLSLGIPEEIVSRPKKAAQYGSLFESEIIRIAKSKGYKNEVDFLRSIYYEVNKKS